jgi:hypothetical protein
MTRFIKWLLLASLLSPLFVWEAQANTVTAASCNVSDVHAAINAASDGDTVLIPSGSCSWSSGITTTKQIKIIGTNIYPNVSGGTVITDADTNSADTLLSVTTGGSFHVVIAGISFLPGTGTGSYITVLGTGLVALMHDMAFNIPNFQLLHAVNWQSQGGVIWHTNWYSTSNLSGTCGEKIGSDSGSLSVVPPGPKWDTPSTMGTLDTNGNENVYLEDNTFTYIGQIPDVGDNGRVVIRHNTFTNISGGLIHGSTGAVGGRFVEIYNNSYLNTNPLRAADRYFWWRAGTAVVTQNHFDALSGGGCYGSKDSLTFSVENAARQGNWGCCQGNMCFHQTGSGSNNQVQSPVSVSGAPQTATDNTQISDPVYVWDNSGAGQGSAHYGFNDGSPRDCPTINPATGNPYTTTDFFHAGRDYFFDDSGTNAGAKPGWAPFTYPHPLRGTTPAPPKNLTVVVQ